VSAGGITTTVAGSGNFGPRSSPEGSGDFSGDAGPADAVCRRLRLIQHATSLGAVESTIGRRASVPGQEHPPPSLLSLRVGIENSEDLWRDLDGALRAARE
jgi:cystathionine gamma-synthase